MHNDPFPDVLRLESSAICNFNCRHCSNGQNHPQERGLLSEEVFEGLKEQFGIKGYIPRVVVLYHGGEPLINNKLPEQIKWFIDHGTKKVKIVSNGSLLTEEKARALIDAGLTDIYFSFDGLSPDENDIIRCNGCFERDSQNVRRFIEIMPSEGLNVKIANVQILTKELFEKWARGEYQITPPQYLVDTFADYLDRIEFVSYPAMVWPGYDRNTSEFDTCVKDIPKTDYCDNLFETVTVLSNGDVVPCCYDIVGRCVFGNVLKENIFDIWNKKEFTDFRQAVRDSDPKGICRECMRFSGEYLLKREL